MFLQLDVAMEMVVMHDSVMRFPTTRFQVRGDGGLLEYRKARSFEVCEDDQERNRTTRFFPQDVRSHSFPFFGRNDAASVDFVHRRSYGIADERLL